MESESKLKPPQLRFNPALWPWMWGPNAFSPLPPAASLTTSPLSSCARALYSAGIRWYPVACDTHNL